MAELMEKPVVNTNTASYLQNADFDDLVFQYGNKEYGAYAVRKAYRNNVIGGVLIGIGVILLIFFLPTLFELLKKKEEVAPVVSREVKLSDLPPPPDLENKPPPPEVQVQEVVKTVKFVPPKVEDDSKVQKDEFVTQKDMENAQISTVTNNVVIPANPGDFQVEQTKEVAPPKPERKVYKFVEKMPSFPGGEGAMAQFLRDNIYYTPQAREQNEQGIVVVQFTVNETGELTDVKIVRGLQYGLNEVALTAIKKMPKWNPGVQNGERVPVTYNVPITFNLQ